MNTMKQINACTNIEYNNVNDNKNDNPIDNNDDNLQDLSGFLSAI